MGSSDKTILDRETFEMFNPALHFHTLLHRHDSSAGAGGGGGRVWLVGAGDEDVSYE